MKVLHFNYSQSGGSGKVANNLVYNQRKYLNYDADLVSIIQTQLRNNVFQDFKTFTLSVIDNYIIKKTKNKQFMSVYRNRDQNIALDRFKKFDGIVHLHWINGMLSHNSILTSTRGPQKIVWTLHDMEFFTGGCHSALNCEGFKKNCGNCPIVKSGFRGVILKNYSQKFSNNWDKITFVVPSLWMINKFKSNPNLNFSNISVIPNPIDETFFDLFEKKKNRKKYHIPEDVFVVGFVSAWIENPLKGFLDLLRILSELSKGSSKEIVLITVGKGLSKSDLYKEVRIFNFGEINDFYKLGEIYSTFDINVSLSSAESFGLTVAEAMAVGVPSLVLKTTASMELIQEGKTGIIGDSLNDAINKLKNIIDGVIVVGDKNYLRDFARESWHPKKIVNAYHKIYENL